MRWGGTLGKKPSLIKQREADDIADKLKKSGNPIQTEIRTGREHDLIFVRQGDELLCQFGIRRSRGAGHGYIPKAMHLSEKQTLDFARCSISVSDWLALYSQRG